MAQKVLLGARNASARNAFYYDSAGSYVLGALVRELTGKTFLEYLWPILNKLGFSEKTRCLKGTDGELWGGSGLLVTTRDFAAFANFLANGGRHNREQLISEKLVREATSAQIANFDGGDERSRAWNRGYGYQIWILKDNAFFLNGMGGQFAIAFPERSLTFACNADTQGYAVVSKQAILEAIWEELLPHFPQKVALDNTLQIPATVQERVQCATYIMDTDEAGICSFKFVFDKPVSYLCYRKNGEDKRIPFGLGKEVEFLFPEEYSGDVLFEKGGYRKYRCFAKAEWIERHKIMISVRAVDDFIGNLTMTFSFVGDDVGVKMKRNAQFFFDGYEGYWGGKLLKTR